MKSFPYLALIAAPLAAYAQPAILTYHNDGSRTGANLQETVLNTSNVNAASFGKLFSRPVDDQLYSQLLYMPAVKVPDRGTHNVIFAATVNDTVYAFDADYPAMTAPLWKVSFLSPGVVPVSSADLSRVGSCGGSYRDFSGNFGIVGTPVIDPAPFPRAPAGDQGTLYVVARTKEGGKFYQRLHALNVQTGAERPGSPVTISGSTGSITFDPMIQNQRPGLALVDGVVYIGWASHCDFSNYHGWLMGYDATTLQKVATFCSTPSGSNGGIWMGGSPPSFDDAGNLYLSTGNGTVGTGTNASNLLNRGESFLKLTRNGSAMAISSYFTPYNYQQLEAGDIDLGSAGLLLMPGSGDTKLAIGAGKQGRLYVVDRDNMGGVQTGSDSQIIQSIDVNLNRKIMGGPVYWEGPGGVRKFYIWAADTTLKAYTFVGPGFNTTPQTSTATASNPGAMLSISANGNTAGTGIVWAMCPTADANQAVVTGVLRAINAENPSQELWNSTQNSNRDSIGAYAKFNQPTVVNGCAYVPTFSNQFLVYGLLSDATSPAAPVLLSATAPSKIQVHLEWSEPAGNSLTGFIVERSADGGVNFDQVMNLPPDATSYDDMTVTRFTDYVYRIRAFNLAGSGESATAAVSTAAGDPEAAIAVTGSNKTIPAGSGFPSLNDGTAFGQLVLGKGSVSHTFTIQNRGNAPLNFTNGDGAVVAISGPAADDFVVTQQPTGPVAPQGSGDFTVTFTPHAEGSRTATVTIANNDPHAAAFSFALMGLGAQQNLAAWWHFNEESVVRITEDASGNGHQGVLSPDRPSLGNSGFFDTAVTYSGVFTATSTQTITVQNAPDLNPVDGITIAGWIAWSGPRSGYSQQIVQKGSADNQYRLFIEDGSLKFDLAQVGVLSTTKLPSTAGTWTHVAATYNGAVMKIYYNGVEAASVNATGPIATTSDPLSIGGKLGTGNHFSGGIDDLRLYGRGLSIDEIQAFSSQRTAISVSAIYPVAQKGASIGMFQFAGQHGGGVNVNFEIVPGPGQAIYRSDYGMSAIPPLVTFPGNDSSSYVYVTPLEFNGPTGPLDVTLRVLEGPGYAVSKNDTAVVHLLDSPVNQWKVDTLGSVANANLPAAADDASFSGDGVPNLIKYALGQNPLEGFTGSSVAGMDLIDDAWYLTLTFQRPYPNPEGITYLPEFRTDLLPGDWDWAPMMDGYPQYNGDGTETVKVRSPDPIGNSQSDRGFLRLRVTRP